MLCVRSALTNSYNNGGFVSMMAKAIMIESGMFPFSSKDRLAADLRQVSTFLQLTAAERSKLEAYVNTLPKEIPLVRATASR